ncbi:MAG: hypothetical protein D6763_09150 [Alphaproteobacteria bacterium]|nr:MAG: hypothetical protein D6763_09150 [Alphaproteobacteria bacterium]
MALPAKRKPPRDPLILPNEALPPVASAAQGQSGQAGQLQTQSAGRSRKRWAGATIKFLVLIVGLGVLAFPTFVVLIGGMVPTLVSILVNERPDRHRIQTIAAFNLSGVVVFLIPLWASGHTVHHAVRLMSDVYTWAVMYTAAALGVGALWLGPQVAAIVSNILAVRKRRKLEAVRAALLDEWGTDLLPEGETSPRDAIGKPDSEATCDRA